MSVLNEERNDLLKRFRKQAVIVIDDTLYSSRLLLPNYRNKRLFPVHDEAVERLNSTMQRHIDGNSQIWETMIYKDQPRSKLIAQFWNGLIQSKEFKALPPRLQELELEQAKKLGPTSRFTIEKLFDGFIAHVDEEAKTRNTHLKEYEKAAEYFADYIAKMCEKAVARNPALKKYLLKRSDEELVSSLPKDKAGGDPYFIRTDRKIQGVAANQLYWRDSKQIDGSVRKVYYTMYSRIQNKGNNIITGIEPADESKSGDLWLPEKNRVVQGDTRSWQFMLKPLSDVITKLPKEVDPNFVGWSDQERKNMVMLNTMKRFHGKVLFDSFDATEYDATTDPDNFAIGIRIIFQVCRKLHVKFNLPNMEHTIDHYLHDPTLTPWGAFLRDSTPSGHNFTGPNGTIVNMLRCYVQEQRRLDVSYPELNRILEADASECIAHFSCVGDDAFQLRDRSRTAASIAEENNSDGFTSNDSKILLEKDFIHYLQFGYYYTGSCSFMGYYPISRVIEHALWQEHANQYTAESVAAQACVQNLNNARYNPCQAYGIEFLMKGDAKYRLGFKTGVISLFKAASQGKDVAEFLDREWDPQYKDMSWESYSEALQPTIEKIESIGSKLGY